MRSIALAAVLGTLLGGCGKSEKDALKEEMESAAKAKKFAEPTGTETVKKTADLPPPPEKKPQEEIKEPDPSKPEEIDEARKKAMILGRDKEVVRFCELGKYVDKPEKGDPQIMLGCTLAACRIMDTDKARNWSKQVARSKPLFDQAVKTCMANKVTL
jgi:hypothetical protein